MLEYGWGTPIELTDVWNETKIIWAGYMVEYGLNASFKNNAILIATNSVYKLPLAMAVWVCILKVDHYLILSSTLLFFGNFHTRGDSKIFTKSLKSLKCIEKSLKNA